MIKNYLRVICNCDINGVLWPRVIFSDNRKLIVDRILHVCPIISSTCDGVNGFSYRCTIKNKNVSLIYECDTNTWLISNPTNYIH